MEYYNNILCLPAHLYYHEYSEGCGKGKVAKEHFVSYVTYKLQAHRGIINVVRKARGAGNYALIELDSIPEKYRELIAEKYPEPEKLALESPLFSLLKKDYKAFEYFTDYRYPDGSAISTQRVDNISLWANNASILNAIGDYYKKHKAARAALGKRPQSTTFFANMSTFVKSERLQQKFPHNLPKSGSRLRRKYEEYAANGYEVLIKRLKGNDNAVKITDELEYLFRAIAELPTRPYTTKVVEIYEAFMEGNYELYDRRTGEEFLLQNYLDKKGKIVRVTESAIWYRLNQPATQVKLDKIRMGAKDYNDLHRPHRHRHSPFYSFSKISMDDRDLIWRDNATKKRVKAYYAYDVASGCRIGSAYSMEKDEALFLDCLRDMFVFIDRYGLGTPMEVEVENHLVNKYFDDLKVMFPHLTICAPGNSQEKRAEHFNRLVKYQVEKNKHSGVGRWWLTSKYNRVSVDKVDDRFKQKMKPAERMIVDDIQDTLEYNNQLHSNQKRYPGKTRLQVLLENVNPDLPKLNKQLHYRYIGYETKTSIVRNMYVQVQYNKYILPHPTVLERLEANNREVVAYWVPNTDGSISEVYLYQNGEYLCNCELLETYNEAKAERTVEDLRAKQKQDRYVAAYDKMVGRDVKERPKLELVRSKTPQLEEVEVVPDKSDTSYAELLDPVDYAQKAVDDFLNL